jgi:hypothetical protein
MGKTLWDKTTIREESYQVTFPILLLKPSMVLFGNLELPGCIKNSVWVKPCGIKTLRLEKSYQGRMDDRLLGLQSP